MSSSTGTLKDWALKYAEMDLAVFPLLPRDKRPATQNGCKAATTDKEMIADWWDKHPDSNIGIATGKTSGLVVIDLDVDEEKDINGYESLKDWQRDHGELPDTWQSITGRGGYHLFYKTDTYNHNRVNLYEGVDVRGDGGYVVAPPSIHPNGRKYEWEQAPGEFEIAQVNEVVAEFLKKDAPENQQIFSVAESIPEGERTSTLVRLIGSLVSKGLEADSIKAAVRAENEKKCVPPLTETELEKTVFPALKRGWKEEQPYTEKKNRVVCDNGAARTLNAPADFDMISAKDLQQLEIEPLEFIVENFLPLGLTVIGAPPKSFKSYMCLDMALSICAGKDFLGFKTKKHGVLYLDLESTYRRPKNRIDQILQGEKAPDNLYIATQAQLLSGGFPEQLKRAIEEHPDIKVVIVDVFKKIRPAASAKNVDGYERDYQDYGMIKEIADKFNVAIVLVTHTTKMKHPDDPFNELTGSSGVMGSIDVAIVIKKEKREDVTAKLYITGRDLEEQCYEMQFSKDKYRWKMQGTHRDMEQLRREFEYRQSPIVGTIKKLVKQNHGEWRGTAGEIKEASKYFDGLYINESKQQIGQKINEFSKMLQMTDFIEFSKKESCRTTEYTFTYNNPFEEME